MSEPRIIQSSDQMVVRESDGDAVIAATPAIVQGQPGPAGPTGAAGTFESSYQGPYNTAEAYSAGDIVSWPTSSGGTGGLYLCLAPASNIAPNNGSYWTLIVERGQQGDQGEAGPPGTAGTGATVNYVAPTWRGLWTPNTQYNAKDWVRADDGSVYHCKVSHTSGSAPGAGGSGSNGPGEDSTKWSLAVEAGQDGSSVRGPRGYAPYIGSNGNWFTKAPNGDVEDTGVKAEGTDGDDGTNGKSAYQLAVQEGYSGTLNQWLNSLEGQDGTDSFADFCFTFASSGTQRVVSPRTITLNTVDTSGSGSYTLTKNGTSFSLSGSASETVSPGDVIAVSVSGIGSGEWKAVTLRGSYGG